MSPKPCLGARYQVLSEANFLVLGRVCYGGKFRNERGPSLDSSSESDPRRRAHELYVARGNESGSELDDWLQAEEEIVLSQEQTPAES